MRLKFGLLRVFVGATLAFTLSAAQGKWQYLGAPSEGPHGPYYPRSYAGYYPGPYPGFYYPGYASPGQDLGRHGNSQKRHAHHAHQHHHK